MHNTVFQVALRGLLAKYEHGYQSLDIRTDTNVLHGNVNNFSNHNMPLHH